MSINLLFLCQCDQLAPQTSIDNLEWLAAGAMVCKYLLFQQGEPDVTFERPFEILPEDLSAFYAARVRGRDDQGRIACKVQGVISEVGIGGQIVGWNSESVLESHEIVYFQRHDVVDARRFQ